MTDVEQDRTKRDLRRRIGRLRRRIDGRLRFRRGGVGRLGAWKSLVTSYPGSTIVAALGVGLALSSGLGARRLSRWLGLRLIRKAVDAAGRQFYQELAGIWADSTPEKQATGVPDDRA